MKKIVVLLIFITIPAISGWNKINVVSRSETLNKIVAISNELIISVGDFGAIKKSNDSGSSWQTVRGGYKLRNLNSVTAFNSNNIIAIGDNGEILKSTDTGNNWSDLFLKVSQNLNDIAVNNSYGIIVGDNSTILISNDNGDNWSEKLYSGDYDLRKVLVYENIVFIITDSNVILKSVDNGLNWEKIEFPQKYRFNNFSVYKNIISLVGSQPEIIETNDNFVNWDIIKYPNNADAYFSYIKVNDSLILSTILISSGTHCYSSDGGKSWIVGGPFVPLSDMTITTNHNNTFICGYQGSIIRVDNSKKMHSPFQMFEPIVELGDKNLNFNFISGYDVANLFSSNQNNAYISMDSGKTWSESLHLNQINIIDIQQVHLSDYYILADSIVFVQENGKSYNKHWYYLYSKTLNNPWQNKLLDSGITLSKMQFDNNFALISGFVNYFFTTDKGQSWTKDSIKTPAYFIDMQLLTNGKLKYVYSKNKDLFLVDTDIYQTNKNEKKINLQDASTSKLYFLNQEFGFLLIPNRFDFNKPSKLYRTTDAGDSWVLVLSVQANITNGLNNIYFSDDLHGICNGYEGIVYHTSDGGLTWFDKSFKSVSIGNDIFYPQQNIAYIAFNEGIYRYENDDVSFVENYNSDLINSIIKIYPNPATSNNTFNVNYCLETSSFINISLINSIGNEVYYIYSGNKDKGEYTMPFNMPSFLSSGIYWLRMKINGDTQIIKPLVIIH